MRVGGKEKKKKEGREEMGKSTVSGVGVVEWCGVGREPEEEMMERKKK